MPFFKIPPSDLDLEVSIQRCVTGDVSFFSVTWPDIVESLKKVEIVDDKKNVGLLSLTKFKHMGEYFKDGTPKTKRRIEHVEKIYGFMIDVDNEKIIEHDQEVTQDLVVERLKQYEFVSYASYNHKQKIRHKNDEAAQIVSYPQGVERFRIVIPFDRYVNATEYRALVLGVEDLFDGIAASESFVMSQFFFIPSGRNIFNDVEKSRKEFEKYYIHNEGELFEVQKYIDKGKEIEKQRVTQYKTSGGKINYRKTTGNYQDEKNISEKFKLVNLRTFRIEDFLRDKGLLVEDHSTNEWRKCVCPLAHLHSNDDPYAGYMYDGSNWAFKCFHTSHGNVGKITRVKFLQLFDEDEIIQYCEKNQVAKTPAFDLIKEKYTWEEQMFHMTFEHQSRYEVYSEKRLRPIPYDPHLKWYFIKSPKGTGKTYQLERLVDEFKARGRSIVAVGHRRSLMSSISDRLDVTNYQTNNYGPGTKYLAICINSLETLLKYDLTEFDVVVIDEVEQVFQSLFGDNETIAKDKRLKFIEIMTNLIISAKHVICLDADLGNLTVQVLSSTIKMLHRKEHVPSYNVIDELLRKNMVIENTYKKPNEVCYLYSDEQRWRDVVFDTIRKKQPDDNIYITTNSKEYANTVAHTLEEENFDVMLFTGETSKLPSHEERLKNLQDAKLRGKVVIATPTIATGFDIQAPFTHVFGNFENSWDIRSTIYDIDQQVNRVRNYQQRHIYAHSKTFKRKTDVFYIVNEVQFEIDTMSRLYDIDTSQVNEKTKMLGNYALYMYSLVQAERREHARNLFTQLKEYYEEQNVDVQVINSSKVDPKLKKAVLKKLKKKIGKEEKAQLIEQVMFAFSNPINALKEEYNIDDVKAETIKTWTDRLRMLFPGEDPTVENIEFVMDKKTFFDYWKAKTFLMCDEELKQKDLKEFENYAPQDLRFHTLKKKLIAGLLASVGMFDVKNNCFTDKKISKGTIAPMEQWLARNDFDGEKTNRVVIEGKFKVKMSGDNWENRPFFALGKILGKVGIKLVDSGKVKIKGTKNFEVFKKIDDKWIEKVKSINPEFGDVKMIFEDKRTVALIQALASLRSKNDEEKNDGETQSSTDGEARSSIDGYTQNT